MQRTTLQKAAAGWAALMAALLLVVALGPTQAGIPPVLLGFFVGLWLFGAVMIWYVPLFGGAGTAAWGLLSGSQALAMHGPTATNLVVIVGSFVGAGLAIAFLVQRWRSR